jgi:glycosyltransferase involved in cell wall biosynthesis
MRHSDFKITHAKEGIQFVAHTTNLKTASKVKYLPHPIVPKQQESTAHFRYDIIIWGTLSRYKGIDQFLKFLWDQNLQEKYAILIAGKIHETSYLEELTNLSSSKIEIRNKFIDEKQLSSLIFQSHIILFTYQLQTVLSSGALTDSVACGKTVIGPATGAFKDLEEYGLVSTYENFPDLITKIDRLLKQEPPKILPALKTFMRENSWEQFAENIHNWVSQQNGEKNHTSQVLSG